MAGKDDISIAEAARILGYKSKKTIRRLGEQGLLDVRKHRGRWVVSKSEIRDARVLTTGRAAKLAGCSSKTARRRIRAGLVKPVRPDEPSNWMCERAVPRLSLADVSAIKSSIVRSSPKRPATNSKRTKINATTGAASRRKRDPNWPQLFQDRTARFWLWWSDRWWKQERPPGSTSRRRDDAHTRLE